MKKIMVLLMLIFSVLGLSGCFDNSPTSLEIIGPTKINIGEIIKLSVVILPENVDSEVIWSSSNEELATVDFEGKVTGIYAGIIEITAVSKANSKISDTLEIEIVDPMASFSFFKTKVLLIDKNNDYIELLNCPSTKLADDVKVYKKTNETKTEVSIDELFLGMENVYVAVNNETNEIANILIDGEKGFNNIRVAIRFSINDISKDETIYHDSISITLLENVVMNTFDGTAYKLLSKNTLLTINYSNMKMVVKAGNEVILETDKRIIFSQINTNDAFKITSISRGSDEIYNGNLEVSIVNERLLLINDVNLEKYLFKVVPSEMPASYHAEALKAQAIAARTYAYMDILRRTYEHLGYTVDDSVKSQVYNNQNPHANTTAAVDATKGMIMMYDGKPIEAYYYSTSSGLTSSAHEVWIEDRVIDPIPYLIGQNLTKDSNNNPLSFNYEDEASMLTFFKTIKMYTPDSTISHHRWRVTFTKAQITNTINTNLKLMYASYPKSILTKTLTGWESLAIPDSIGEVTNIYVNERGTSGVVISLAIETTTGTYLIINQYNIRFTIRPKDAGSEVRRYFATGDATTYTNHATNDSILLSGFFAIEIIDNNYTFYGGGNGHGVGMSQNGANSLGKAGRTHQQILTTYYSNILLTDITYNYLPLENFQEYFK